MEDVLWPHMLRHTIPIQVAGSLATVCKSLTYLAQKRKAAGAADFIIDFDRFVNLPKPPALIARMFVSLCAPTRRNAGVRILEMLQSMAEVLHPAIAEPWSGMIPKLVAFLGQTERFTQKAWEDALLRVFASTLAAVGDDEWTVAVGTALSEQCAFYKPDPQLKVYMLIAARC